MMGALSLTGVDYFTQATVATSAPLSGASLAVSDFISREPKRQPMRVRLPDHLDLAARRALMHAIQQLARLRQLDKGWDGAKAEPLTDDACDTAIRLLTALAMPAPPTAQLVPLEDGGLQLEWHVEGNDVELEIDAQGEVHAYIIAAAVTVLNREVPQALLPTTMPEIRRYITRMSRILNEQA